MNQFIKYAKHVGLDSYGINWVKNVIGAQENKGSLTTEEVEHIIDFLASDAAPKRIAKMSYEQAKVAAENWLKAQIKKGSEIQESKLDTETVLDFGDGFKIVKLIGENAYKREGFLMKHCVASYYKKAIEVYSLRDANNMPHCTMEKNKQIKGKGNGNIDPNYVDYVVKFLKHVGMNVGDSEMAHLGYINVEEFKDELSSELFNGKYHYKGQKLLDKEYKEFVDIRLWDKIPLVEFSSSYDFKINFDLNVFLSKAIEKIFSFLKEIKNVTQLDDKNYSAQIASSGDSAKIGSSGNNAQIASSGYNAKIAISGYNAKIGTSGDSAQIGISDYNAQIASSGSSAKIASSGYNAKIGTSGNSAQIASSGDYAQIASSGNSAQIASSGDSAQIGISGNSAQIASSGDSAQIGISGDSAQIASSGDSAMIELNGDKSVGVSAGINCTIKGKKGNWITLSEWREDSDNYFIPVCVKSAQIDGEILKEDTFYRIENGEFVEVA
jgi:hypothetical protein